MDPMTDDILDIDPPMRHLEVDAVAEFTRDMADTLAQYFEFYAAKGVVEIEVTESGLWLRNPATGGRQFLGRARLGNVN